MTKQKKMSMWSGLISTASVLLATVVAGTVVTQETSMKDYVNGFFGTRSYDIVNTDGNTDTTYYKSDFKTIGELKDARNALFEEILEEGSVLMKNNGALPLKEKSKITLMGYGSYDPVYTAAGGGESYGSSDASIDLKTACDRNFTVNDVMHQFYVDGGKSSRKSGSGFMGGKYNIVERDPDTFTDAVNTSFKSFNDAAIVTLSRTAGEGSDMMYTPVPTDQGGDGVHDMLQLTDVERKVVAKAKENFDKVIVLVNSDNPLSVEELKNDDGIDAILWIGTPGIWGMYGVSDILCGKANPSGGLVDTFAADPKTSPAMQNFGDFTFQGATEEMVAAKGNKYVIYAEGIYAGYRYYETRYEDVVLKQGNASDAVGASKGNTWNYNNEVSYPFGYGLSYTTFNQTLDSITVDVAKQTATAQITVTNTGNVAGKTKVQLWAQSPYTDYDKTNKVEKSAIQLLGYTKTEELAPGAQAKIELDLQLKYLASYDYTKAKTYIMEDGDYYFAVGNGSHEALNNVLALKGKTKADGMDADGDKAAAKKFTNKKFTLYDISYNNKEVTNILDVMDINSDQNLGTNFVTYLTRNDWKGTYPKTYTEVTPTEAMKKELSSNTYVKDESFTDPITTESTKTQYTLVDLLELKDKPYDPMWDDFLDQWSLQELCSIVGTDEAIVDEDTQRVLLPQHKLQDAGRGINKNWWGAYNEQRPYGVTKEEAASDPYLQAKCNTYPSSCLQAGCFSTEIMTKIGHMFAEDGLWSNHSGLNLGFDFHRTPYFGRLNAAYSEDSVLQSITGQYLVIAMQEKGLLAAPKHFAFNSQETNRQGVATFVNEQRARELELRSYEGAYCEGKAMWGMNSFPRAGCRAVAQCKELLIDLLRNEWGFMGWLETDMLQTAYMYHDSTMVNGSGKYPFGGKYVQPLVDSCKDNIELQHAVRENARRRAYTLINSNAINGYSANTKIVFRPAWWETTLFVMIGVFAAALAAFTVMFVVSAIKKDE